jgi:hypothetical protein
MFGKSVSRIGALTVTHQRVLRRYGDIGAAAIESESASRPTIARRTAQPVRASIAATLPPCEFMTTSFRTSARPAEEQGRCDWCVLNTLRRIACAPAHLVIPRWMSDQNTHSTWTP